ncbi:hypothetical protein SAMN04487949_3204 [Halogranum gelatinilyticum]|uniref:PGF-CTERM protein n=1 Tax=Halogranum gelatinilyticum TaxID=660521 RepID=A0A1G9Y016_9EURY|nr:Hvo_1808 family surface protein [Halogranum gelatinilyticum]SDN02370.1 hypothetical protein SAMN04487949_3204 [Halogranum gelatinilyticum]
MRRLIALCLVSLVLSGCAAPTGAPTAADGDWQFPDDPPSDRIGWENGYWHNESIDVDQSDGLSDAELEAYVARSMARVEHLRDREFKESVPVEVISREAYRQQSADSSQRDDSFEAWNNQVWEALFITGEQQNVQSELGSTFGAAVAGFYSPSDDEIKIVTDSPDRPVIDNATLHHELVHAMQDQYHNLASNTYRAESQDGDLAVSGVVEGEANYIEYLYLEKCGGEWECVETPRSGGGGGGGNLNLGIYLVIFQPYSDGPVFVHDLYQEGGWDAVEERFENPPVSSEQVIHRTGEEPVPIEYTDRARNGWSLFDEGLDGSDTVGEASLYAMFWYQDREGTEGFEGFDWREVGQTEGEYDQLNYDSTATAGWANDRVFPYAKGEGDDAEYGYVWELEWDTERDATQFRETYLAMLRANGATEQGENVYVVPEGAFADAFRVTQDGTRITVVNAPTVDDLGDVRPTSAQADGSGASDASGDDGGDSATAGDGDDSTDAQSPGFGLFAGLVALVVSLAVAAGVGRRD